MFKLLILVAVGATAWLVNKKGEDTEDSLFKLGNRLRTLEDDIQELKQSVQALESQLESTSSKATPAKKGPAKKAPAKKKAAKKS